MWIFAVMLAVPLIEIALFVTVGGWLTLWPTLAIVLATGVIGSVLVRAQGLQVLAELRGALGQAGNPLSPLAHGALLLVAGLLLITPGFFTDTIGFLLLAPPIRRAVIAMAARNIRFETMAPRRGGPANWPDNNVIDGEFTPVEPTDPAPRGPSGWTRH